MRGLCFLFAFLLTLPLVAQQPTREQLANIQRGDSLQHLFKQQPDGGIAMALQHVKAEPKNPFAYLVLADVYASVGRFKPSLKAFRQGYKYAGKGLTFERRVLASAEVSTYLMAKDTLAAYQTLDRVLKLDPHHDWFNLRYAEISEQQGKTEQARTYFLRGVRSGHLKNRIALANFEMRKGNFAAAIAQFDSIRSVDPLHPQVVERLPLALIADQQYDRALPLVLDHVGSSGAAYPSLVSLRFLYKEQPEKVVAALQEHRRTRPKQSEWPIAEGYLYGSQSRTYEALQCYQAAWEIQPSNRLKELLGWGYDFLAQPDRALFYLQQLPEKQRGPSDYFLSQMPRLYFQAGQHQVALEKINALIAQNDTVYPLIAERMGMFTALHRDAEALADCEYLLKRFPKHLHYHYCRGRLLHYLGRTEASKQALEGALHLVLENLLQEGLSQPNFKDNPPSTLDFIYFYLGEHQEALATLERRLAGNPSKGELYDAACLHALLGNKEQAMTYLKQAMEKGYLKIFHIKTDRDLETLHALPAFQQLIDEYHEKIKTGVLSVKD